MSTITINATRSDGWWTATSEDIPGFVTQVRRLEHVEEYARDIAELSGQYTPEELDNLTFHINTPESTIATEAAQATRDARKAQEKATALMRKAAKELSTQGLPYRDIGTLLGVSFQRAQKLATS